MIYRKICPTKGEVASQIVVDTFAQYLQDTPITNWINQWAKTLVSQILKKLMAYAYKNPKSLGMGATLAALIQVDKDFYTIHIGDSRVYHFDKDGTIKWCTTDHTLVQELLDAEIITPQQAKEHPKRNIITSGLSRLNFRVGCY